MRAAPVTGISRRADRACPRPFPYRCLTPNLPNLFSRQLYVSGGDSPMGLAEAVSRETAFIGAVARTLILTRGVHPDAKLTIVDWTERWARERPLSPAILHEDRTVTWGELDRGANRYARWAKALG